MPIKKCLTVFCLVIFLGGLIIACSQHQKEIPFNTSTEETHFFHTAATCAACHRDQPVQQSAEKIDISANWQRSMMAYAAVDPYFLAGVSKEILLFPEHQQEIEDSCATCHTPMARTEHILTESSPESLLGEGYLNPDHPLYYLALDGVSCTLCHQIENINLNNEASFSGQYAISAENQPGTLPAYGPFLVPPGLANMMSSASGYVPTQSEHIQTSELCATCHTLYTYPIDETGEISSTPFPEQMTYIEWEFSDTAPDTSCQDCHMPEIEAPVRLTNQHGPYRDNVSEHTFTSANSYLLKLLSTFREELLPPSEEVDFQQSLAETNELLTQKSLQIELDACRHDNDVIVTVNLINLVGHKLPSSYPSRRVWLHLTAVNENTGDIFFESGEYMTDGNIPDNQNDQTADRFEPHYVIITDETQVQIYESIMIDSTGALTTSLLSAANYIKDNRLLPAGFDKENVFIDVAVHGKALNDPNFQGGGDSIEYHMPVDGINALTITLEVLYQSISYRWIENFRLFDSKPIHAFLNYVTEEPNTPMVMAFEILTSPLKNCADVP